MARQPFTPFLKLAFIATASLWSNGTALARFHGGATYGMSGGGTPYITYDSFQVQPYISSGFGAYTYDTDWAQPYPARGYSGYSFNRPAPAYRAPAPDAGGTEESETTAGAPVTVRVRVPADAAIWFGGHRTRQTGAWRIFRSPSLDPG